MEKMYKEINKIRKIIYENNKNTRLNKNNLRL